MIRINKKLVAALMALSVSISGYAQEIGDVLTMGDSLTAGLARNSQGQLTCAAQGGRVVASNNQRSCRGDGREGVGGWQPGLKSLTQSSVYNFGNSGERTSEMAARFPSHLASTPGQFVLILGGTNDMIFGGSVAGAVSNLSLMIQATLDADRIPIIATAPPLTGSVFASSNTRIQQLNVAIRDLPMSFEGLVVADIYNAVVADWATLSSSDNIHFGAAGNVVVANLWFDSMQQALASDQVPYMPAIIEFLLSDTP